MSDPTRDEALERHLSALGSPAARAEFRRELRERFIDVGGAAQAPQTLQSASHARRRHSGLWLVLGACAATIVLIVASVLTRDDPAPWRVAEASGAILIDGVEFDAGATARIEEALISGREIEARDGELRLVVRDELALELSAGTKLSQVRFPPAGPYSVRADKGSLRVTTGPRFSGTKLRVLTEDMELGVVGTTFGVDIFGSGTCVCCIEGELEVTPQGEAARPLSGENLCFAYRDRQPAKWTGIYPDHAVALQKLVEWSRRQGPAKQR